MGISIKEKIINLGNNYPQKFRERRGNILTLDFVVAQRKAFLRTDKLTYHCKLKINDHDKKVIFFETLRESGAGVSTGGYDEFSTGFGFRTEKTSIRGKERESTIEQKSNLFGKKYDYTFEFGKIRKDIKKVADSHGYSFDTLLAERNVR